jgi:hypothetical protein
VEAAQTLGIALVAGFVLVGFAGTWQAIRVWRTARALREADTDGDDYIVEEVGLDPTGKRWALVRLDGKSGATVWQVSEESSSSTTGWAAIRGLPYNSADRASAYAIYCDALAGNLPNLPQS